jgi:hypothetical protein
LITLQKVYNGYRRPDFDYRVCRLPIFNPKDGVVEVVEWTNYLLFDQMVAFKVAPGQPHTPARRSAVEINILQEPATIEAERPESLARRDKGQNAVVQ